MEPVPPELQELIQERTDRYNSTPVVDFEGLSPDDMHGLLYFPFDEARSPLVFKDASGCNELGSLPLLKHFRTFMEELRAREPLKLTVNKNLPVAFCRRMCELELYEDPYFKEALERFSLRNESEYIYLENLDWMARNGGLLRIAKGKMSLGPKGRRLLDGWKDHEAYWLLFFLGTTKLNWAMNDRYPESRMIQRGFGFSIRLVQKYGDVPRPVKFYSDKYRVAFPNIMLDFREVGNNAEWQYASSYRIRVFRCFLERFGIVSISGGRDLPERDETARKTPLADKLFGWRRPRGPPSGMPSS